MSTFGLIVPGRPIDTSFQQVDVNKFLITIPNADTINHVVVFLTGVTPVPPDVACCIYFSLPDSNAPPTWNYLGFLTNDKPSSIYKITNIAAAHTRNMSANSMSPMPISNSGMAFNFAQAPVLHVAQIGISVEPLSQVVQMVPAIETVASKVDTFTEFVNKTVGNLFNYCSSFSRPAAELLMPASGVTPSTQFIPLSTIQTWYENYLRKLSNDKDFWKSLT